MRVARSASRACGRELSASRPDYPTLESLAMDFKLSPEQERFRAELRGVSKRFAATQALDNVGSVLFADFVPPVVKLGPHRTGLLR